MDNGRAGSPLFHPFPTLSMPASRLILFSGLAAAMLAVLAAPPVLAEAGPLRVFLLAGQSNMEGQGVVSMDHPDHYNG
ncbi:MAG: hypothetical protein HKN82_14210, partial [Akkermansiaceae bacterium]|nr:hypothetical protein [Akkermansiaceae bacterium]